MSRNTRLSRRRFFTGVAGTVGAAVTAAHLRSGSARAEGMAAEASDPADRKLLFVVCASGGASIIDSVLPVTTDELPEGSDAASLNVYEPSRVIQPAGSNIRCVAPLSPLDQLFFTPQYSIQEFVEAHHAHMTVVTQEATSVNHAVAQKRAMTGAGINRGRTIAEAVAERHGRGLPLANCNMGSGGYLEPGDDRTLAGRARGEIITNPRAYAMATHGSRGLEGIPGAQQLLRARGIREQLDDASPFGETYRNAPLRERYLSMRRELGPMLEEQDAITKLMLTPQDDIPAALGLESSPMADQVRDALPNLDKDSWQQQGGMAFLLAYYGMSCASTIGVGGTSFDGDTVVSAPLAFDFSHTVHRTAQGVMWSRVLQVVSGLITLLQRHDYLGDPALGKMWDRSLIYIATDFGRDKLRPATSPDFYGTGHHLNNGTVLLSPMLVGNRVFGGVDPQTLLTYGFDRRTGEAAPGTVMREGDIYSLIAQAMDVDFDGRRDMSAALA